MRSIGDDGVWLLRELGQETGERFEDKDYGCRVQNLGFWVEGTGCRV